jgi:DNA-binding LacI/PurR family transcriptional regulator
LIYKLYDSNALDEKLVVNLFQKNRADGMITLACNRDDRWLDKYAEDTPSFSAPSMLRTWSCRIFFVDNRLAAREIRKPPHRLRAPAHRDWLQAPTATFPAPTACADIWTRWRKRGWKRVNALIAYASADYSFASGKQAARKLLTIPNPPSAIFCVSDILALGVYCRIGQSWGESA